MDFYVEFALGVLSWSPSDFWQATPYEFWRAFDGFMTAKGYFKESILSAGECQELKNMALAERKKELEAEAARGRNING